MSDSSKSKMRFSLRALLLAIAFISVSLTIPVWHARNIIRTEAEAARQIEKLGGTCIDEYAPPRLRWLEILYGKEYYTYINRVDFDIPPMTEENVIEMLPHIEKFRLKKDLSIDGKTVFLLVSTGRNASWKKVYEVYKQKLPYCIFLTSL